MLGLLLIVPILGAAVVSSQDSPSSSACAKVSQSLASNSSSTPSVPGSLAYDCLRSVPNRPGPAQKLIQSLKSFVQWQTTLAWLKNPPDSYTLPAIDIQASLDNISSTASIGGFTSEYDFQLAILETIAAAHDGHFSYYGDVFKAFYFSNDLAADIVSVSSNGTSPPKLYRYSALNSGSETEPAAITKINGEDAAAFIENVGLRLSYPQDIDAQWNSLLAVYANPYPGNYWISGSIFSGLNLTLTYEDGTTESQETYATLKRGVDFSEIATGDDFYEAFCNPNTTFSSSSSSSDTPSRTKKRLAARASGLSYYPSPIVQNGNDPTAMGFFLNDTGFEDVAVLALTSFESSDSSDSQYINNFQEMVETFLNKSRSAGKQRLVIDLTENLGGEILAGFELFAQLFPGVDPVNANNMRLSESLTNISHIFANMSEEEQEQAVNSSLAIGSLLAVDLYRPQGKKFDTVDELLTPVTLQGDEFTAYFRQPTRQTGFTLTGTGDRSNPPPAVFKPENVVLLTDGNCESTCTIFSYLMLFHENIKTVTVGGRPETGKIQSIGGTEGSQVLQFSYITTLASQALDLVTDQTQSEQLRNSELGVLAEGYAPSRAVSKSNSGAINFKNAFAPNDANTPLQFLYEPANCHFFYTSDMIYGPELVWQYAVNATWTDPDTYCVKGSITPVNTSQTLDPVFDNPSNGSDTSNGSKTSPNTDGTNNQADKPSSAPGVGLKQGAMWTTSLLAAVAAVMLYL
ncbi:uncharacterized protein F4822DRAFT_253115 [Hypoxylon trugodes]|uniref:uncharacterized protein n=1 Tax=Hypoxylon trugodes TaxID=326681 RepID=UPI00219FC2EC|nr:uncharacterized protein F4822DRAFT_253115 [Hypoxylon trugodes]KAI1388675.1 hypothetical protein F4822DRAFT_253115 [Hypoxylon trugodes]